MNHLHTKNRGCDIINRTIKSKNKGYSVKGGYCKTHEVEICKCGWEFGWHFNTESAKMKTEGKL